ncbi:hypothetical protein RRF57_003958 [Xylaria bambusicola]|uniref:Uncharacterized protein n=1 Tax=Xylaria bambusicola TaxID=326684 RepID=A0AAN7UFW5_9PEZI
MAQAMEAVRSTARCLEPYLEILSRTDGIEEAHDQQTRVIEQLNHSFDEAEIREKDLENRRKDIDKILQNHCHSCRFQLRNLLSKKAKAKFEAEETEIRNRHFEIVKTLEKAINEKENLANKKSNALMLHRRQRDEIKRRTSSQKKIDNAYNAWFAGPTPPSFEVYIAGQRVQKLQAIITTLQLQVAHHEEAEDILNRATHRMELVLKEFDDARNLCPSSLIMKYPYLTTVKKRNLCLYAADQHLVWVRILVKRAHRLCPMTTSLPSYNESVVVGNLSQLAMEHMVVVVGRLKVYQCSIHDLLKKAKGLTQERKAQLEFTTSSLADAKVELAKEKRYIIRQLACDDYINMEAPPPYSLPPDTGVAPLGNRE